MRLSVPNRLAGMSGDILDINNTSLPKCAAANGSGERFAAGYFVGRVASDVLRSAQIPSLLRHNNQLYFGMWGRANTGAGNATRGNNPLSGSVYTNPLAIGKQMPFNPLTQIQDANGNLLILTGYGHGRHNGSSSPGSFSGGHYCNSRFAGATTQCTVVDPLAQGFPHLADAFAIRESWCGSSIFERKPAACPVSRALNALILPIPDEYVHVFRQGCITTAYRYSPDPQVRQKYDGELRIRDVVLMKGRIQGDREPENHSFIPTGGVVASPGGPCHSSPRQSLRRRRLPVIWRTPSRPV